MFDVYTAVRAYLLADASIASTVSTRVYPVTLPQSATLPAITLLVVTDTPQANVGGPASAMQSRLQVDCWAKATSGGAAFKTVQGLGNDVITRLDGFFGTLTDSTGSPDTSVSASIRLLDKRDIPSGDLDGDIVRHSADYAVFHGVNGT